eukprot:JP446095.1.p1 GENE.JP446095.1~~JP446095.1.p1  ORF type:complete len:533 (-),score=206.33 JP446095.1:53-1651(-)
MASEFHPATMLAEAAAKAAGACEESYGFLPCSPSALGNVFLMLVYGGILLIGAKFISDGSELLMEVMDPGIIGGLVLPILGAVPDSAIILMSGIGGSLAQAQEQVTVGVGTLAGSTIMLLTIAWAGSVWVGRCDLVEQNDRLVAKDRSLRPDNKYSLTATGVTVDEMTKTNALIMCVTAGAYLIIQIPAFVDEKKDRIFALVGFIVCIICLAAYCAFQVLTPGFQEKKFANARSNLVAAKARQMATRFGLKNGPVNANGQCTEASLTEYFHFLDKSGDGAITREELMAANESSLGIKCDPTDVDMWMKEMDKDQNNEISLQEFLPVMKKWLEKDMGAAETAQEIESSRLILADEEKDEDEDDEEESSEEMTKGQILFNAIIYLLIGTGIVSLFSDPMVDVISAFSKITKLNAFVVSFVVTPLASNASELVSSIIFASKKKKKNMCLTMGQIYGAVTMNNTMCLGIFLALVYFRGLLWEFSAEVAAILTMTWAVGAIGCTHLTLKTYLTPLILLLYPLSLVEVMLLQDYANWK